MHFRRVFLLSLMLLSSTAALAANASGSATGTWQAHTAKFFYFGRTSLYTCDGLELKVKYILLQLGARKDAQVRAAGCDRSSLDPTANSWVEMKFHTVAAADNITGADAVQAQWVDFEIAPNRPSNMGAGECELIEQMKPAITASFAMRDLKYRVTCVPHQVSFADYGISGKILRAVAIPKQ